MTRETVKANINFNSVLLMVITALSAWTLKTVFDLAVAGSATNAQVINNTREINRLDSRVTTIEHNGH